MHQYTHWRAVKLSTDAHFNVAGCSVCVTYKNQYYILMLLYNTLSYRYKNEEKYFWGSENTLQGKWLCFLKNMISLFPLSIVKNRRKNYFLLFMIPFRIWTCQRKYVNHYWFNGNKMNKIMLLQNTVLTYHMFMKNIALLS